MANNFRKHAEHLAQANHHAASPLGLLESQLAIEDKLKITRPAHLSLPAPKVKGKKPTPEPEAEITE